MIASDPILTKRGRRFWTAVWTVWAMNLLTIASLVAYQLAVGTT